MKKTINYYGSFIVLMLGVSIFFTILIKAGWINQNIFLPTMRCLNDLINNLFF